MNVWLTPHETIAVLAALDPRHPITYRQLRYWDEAGIVPASRAKATTRPTHWNGPGRLYDAEGVAFLRLALRILAKGRSLRQVSEALRYCEADIRTGFHEGEYVLTFGARGVAEVKVSRSAERYDLRACFDGVDEAMRMQRREQPRGVWTGLGFVRPSELEVVAVA